MSRHVYPLRVTHSAHGIRAQDLRTLSRSAWWARRWIAALETMRLGPRLGRGRQYALSGQVTELTRQGPHVTATVVGSRAEPYHVTLDFTSVDDLKVRAPVEETLRADPMTLARLATDDLPIEVDALFRMHGLALFPGGEREPGPDGRKRYDVKMNCSCPDWARPCKHLVAVMFLLGEEVTRRPEALLALRGVELDDLLPPAETNPKDESPAPSAARDAPLTPPPDSPAADPAPLVTRLGPVPAWRGTVRCVEALGHIAGRVRPVAQAAARGESIDLR